MSLIQRLRNPGDLFRESFMITSCVSHVSAVRLSLCLSLPCSDARHVALPFALDHQCQHYIPVWSSAVTCFLPPLQAFAFTLLACRRSNRITSKKHDREMSEVVEVRTQPRKYLFAYFITRLHVSICLVGKFAR